MINLSEIKQSTLVSIWFMFLTFPLVVVRVIPMEDTVEWRWKNMFMVGIGTFIISFFWRYYLQRKEMGSKTNGSGEGLPAGPTLGERLMTDKKLYLPALIALGAVTLLFPFVFSAYQTNIMTTALIYVILGLGLNIVVGVAGLLDLGYVAFYAVGAYTYGLLNHHFGFGFWTVLPIGAFVGAFCGVLLGFPVLRLRGDYLAIVTLGFGEIIRLVLENWDRVTFGPSGIAHIARPGFFGMEMDLHTAIIYVYFIVIGLTLGTIFFVNRLQNSRIGRAWVALREDEIACQAMGIDKTKTKLAAFSLGATWAGMVGVLFAAKTTFINPASFTFMESAIILSIVVLGGMGSILGVVLGAFLLILLPEYLRELGDYRMLAFGASMVIMMVFRPQGLISNVRRKYKLSDLVKR